MPIENARINEALKRSYDEVTSFNRAKERVIHHLSHDLKTPVPVLAAAFELIRNVRPLVLDVRTSREYKSGHLKGATLIPVQELQGRLTELAAYKNENILIYCEPKKML